MASRRPRARSWGDDNVGPRPRHRPGHQLQQGDAGRRRRRHRQQGQRAARPVDAAARLGRPVPGRHLGQHPDRGRRRAGRARRSGADQGCRTVHPARVATALGPGDRTTRRADDQLAGPAHRGRLSPACRVRPRASGPGTERPAGGPHVLRDQGDLAAGCLRPGPSAVPAGRALPRHRRQLAALPARRRPRHRDRERGPHPADERPGWTLGRRAPRPVSAFRSSVYPRSPPPRAVSRRPADWARSPPMFRSQR